MSTSPGTTALGLAAQALDAQRPAEAAARLTEALDQTRDKLELETLLSLRNYCCCLIGRDWRQDRHYCTFCATVRRATFGVDALKPQLNHLIVWATDRHAAAVFFAEVVGLGAPTEFGHFTVVETGNGVSIDFGDGEPNRMHLALLVTEREFDEILGRIVEMGVPHWADPRRSRPGEINHGDGGRGVYFSDPNTRVGWEIITRPYGSGPHRTATGQS